MAEIGHSSNIYLKLSALASQRSVFVQWPLCAAGYTLQSTPVLGAGASWQAVGGTPVLTNSSYQVTLLATNTQFLRLTK